LYKFTRLISIFVLFISLNSFGQENLLEEGTDKLLLLGCTNNSGIINITGTGNIQSNKAYFGAETTLDEINMLFDVVVDSVNSNGDFRFGVGKYSGIAGTLVEFSGTDTTTNVIISKLNGTSPTFISQFPLPFHFNIGNEYKIRIGKKVRQLIIEVNTVDSVAHFFYDSLSYPTPFFGCLWGRPFIGCASGSISVNSFRLTTPFDLSPRVSVWGDSFVEANSLANVEDRYVSLIRDSIGFQNMAISGRGGESSTTINTRFSKESKWFKDSKYGIIAIGVNDVNFSTWKTNILRQIDTLKSHNIIPIITTLTPRADRLPFISLVNNWIRNSYNGAYIDLNRAVTTSSETHWLSGLALIDSIHPSAAGHLAIYERIKLEAPYIFRDSSAFTIDFVSETTFENLDSSLEVSTVSDFLNSTVGAMTPVNVIPGQTLFFRDTLIVPGIRMLYDILPVPLRPQMPTNPVADLVDNSFDWSNNPLFMNVGDYEFSVDSGATWTICSQKPIISPGTNTLKVRVKADSLHFKSEPLIINMQVPDAIASLSEENFNVFPNPFQDKLMFENIPDGAMMSMFGADGRHIYSETTHQDAFVINTDGLAAGLYFVTISTGQSVKTLKLIRN
jgi:lysophospholipase L1-like esterase